MGGALRDELLGREVTDIDIAVEGDPETAARELASEVRGPVFRLSEAFGAWRVVDRRGGRIYDFAALQGETIEEDLARRDFTINAMARASGDDDLIDRDQPFEHGGEEQALLRRAEPRRRAGGEDDGSDQDDVTVTFSITTGIEGGPSPTPSLSIACTVSAVAPTSKSAKLSGTVRLAGAKRASASRSGKGKVKLTVRSTKRLKKGQKVVLKIKSGKTTKIVTVKAS